LEDHDLAVRPFVHPDLLAADDPNRCAEPVEKIAVVAGDDQRSPVRLKGLLQSFPRWEIEVVRRFVQEEQVGSPGDQLQQLQPRALTTREIPDRLEHGISPEEQRREHRPLRRTARVLQ
jgi:hypothetical protein